MKTTINVQAHAKINLCLNVARRREDGYHDMEMVMVPLTLHDDITVTFADEDRLYCDDKTLLLDDSNTITKAIQLMREEFHVQAHFAVHLKKHIPMQAGLAGGSSDAAAVLCAINEMLELKIPLTELAQVSKQIGADVPFCVMNTCAVVSGIGETIQPIQMNCDFHILLVKPEAGVSTGKAFQRLNLEQCEHPVCDDMKDACEHHNFQKLCRCLGNSLEYSAFQMVPELKDIKHDLQALGFEGVLMSGSGSTIFALTQNEQLIKETMMLWKDKFAFICKTKICKENICL